MIVDGVWSAVGSTNFDDRAFEINDEITLGFVDPAFARKLELVFESDAKECVELELGKWRRRGALHRLKDNFYYLFNEQL
jgi:cardiolipin synthase